MSKSGVTKFQTPITQTLDLKSLDYKNSDPETLDPKKLRPSKLKLKKLEKDLNSSKSLSPEVFCGHAMFIGNRKKCPKGARCFAVYRCHVDQTVKNQQGLNSSRHFGEIC